MALDSATEDHVAARFAADAHAPAQARDALRPLEGRLDPERLLEVELVTSELVTNAVRHSIPQNGDRGIRLEVADAGGALRVSVTDPGAGFDPCAPRATPGEDGGWGLYLVEELADAWWIERRDGTRITAEFRL